VEFFIFTTNCIDMFFILSKVLSFFIQPFNWLLILAAWTFFTKNPKRKKRLIVVTLVSFLFFSNPWIIHKVLLAWQAPEKEMVKDEQYQAGILLSGFGGFKLSTGKGYFKGASDRFIQTVRLYKTGHIKKIIVTGGNSSIWKNRQEYKEGDFIVEQLLQMGIPPADIYIDNQSRNTHENGVNTKKIIDSLGMKGPFLLITSATHIRRAKLVFDKTGLQTTPYPCNFAVLDNPFLFWQAITPTYRSFEGWDTFMKESVGLLMYRITGKA
jgi:uncharacterized SAM-binding protein YcdF (DUF218 family)